MQTSSRRQGTATVHRRDQASPQHRDDLKGPQNDPYLAEQKALIDSVRTGKPINSGFHMNNSTLAGVMGQMACYTGAPVTWDEARRSALQYVPSSEDSNFETRPPCLPDKSGNYPLPRPGVTRLDGKA